MATTGGITYPSFVLTEPYGVVDLGLTVPTTNILALPNVSHRVKGVRMPHGVITAFYMPFYPSAGTVMTTGLTFNLMIAMDPIAANSDLTGTNAYFDVIGAPIVSGTSTPDDSIFASSTLGTITFSSLPTSATVLASGSVAISAANLNSWGANTWGLIRVRRNGSNVLDTNLGVVNLVGVGIVGT